MSVNKSSISKETTYAGIGEYWDSHELPDSVFESDDIEVEIDLAPDKHYFLIDEKLTEEISQIAASDGVNRTALLNQWIREKVAERRAP